MFSSMQLLVIGFVYLVVLFGSAYATERGYVPKVIVNHPATRVLSLGVFAGAIAFYGMVSLAAAYGPGFILYFVGASCAFILAPLLLGRLSRIALAHKLGSLADLFAFRYPAPWVGGVISVLMLLGVLPLLALQIQAVAGTLQILNRDLEENVLAMIFCTTIGVFAILFGARHLSTRDKHQGLVVAMGLESVIKLVAMGFLAYHCVTQVFGGTAGMIAFAGTLPPRDAVDAGTARILLLTAFAATIAMPQVYHMLITENDDPRTLAGARWGFPVYMLLFSLCIPPLYFAGAALGISDTTGFIPPKIGVAINDPTFALLTFIVCMAAASSVMIVTTLALASMTLNHVLLPLARPSRGVDIYMVLLYARRVLIALIILTAFAVQQLLGDSQSLMSLAVISFTAVLQFLPGLIAGFYWERANRLGLLAGLLAGYLVWFLYLMLPLTVSLAQGLSFEFNSTYGQTAVLGSLGANLLLLIAVSAVTRPAAEEQIAAGICAANGPPSTLRGELTASSVNEMERNLALVLGQAASSREVMLALDELRFAPDERRPHALRQLREQMESNLSSTLGQTIAHRIIGSVLPLKQASTSLLQMESHLETYRSQLTGLAAELDSLRQYHRQLLHHLPTAVCSLDRDLKIRTWNQAMEVLSALPARTAVDSDVDKLPDPWRTLFRTFALDELTHRHRVEVDVDGRSLCLNLHKTTLGEHVLAEGDIVIVVDDLTETQFMEEQLIHKERLASIGRFAAGVAHEIGNPVTGIACLAQDLKMDLADPEMKALSEEILTQTNRISAILQSLVNFAYGNKEGSNRPLMPVQLHQCVDEAIRLISLSRTGPEVTFTNNCAAELQTMGDTQRLCQVFVNILANAQDASTDGDEISVDAQHLDDSIMVTVTDQGHGIPGDQLSKVFEPFFTTKDPNRGTGLGLAIVSTIIQEHHGSIHAERAGDGGGTRIRIRLPLLIPDRLTSDGESRLISPQEDETFER